jgi:geranylgeranyl reductase family protein
MEAVDILIVGAGPAGLASAFILGKAGLKVVIIEQKKEIGKPVMCAEFIPKLTLREIPVSSSAIAQVIHKMVIYFPSEKSISLKTEGVILNREIFEKALTRKVKELGVKVLLNTTFTTFNSGIPLLKIKKGREYLQIRAKVIIAADGPLSQVGLTLGNVNKEFITAFQVQVPLRQNISHGEVYFFSEFFGGYAWLFPKGKIANLGVGIKGIKRRRELKLLLKKFRERLVKAGKLYPRILATTGGLIPVGGILPRVNINNILFAGDAAGLAHPITGAGISSAIISGKLVGETVVGYLKGKSKFSDYKNKLLALLGDEYERALEKRKFLEVHWNELEEILPKCWSGFRQYYG